VLNKGLRRLLDYQLITRAQFRDRILRVEYELTTTRKKLAKIIEQIRDS
jgi:DNA-binding HxlR family transcriptional regulator